MNEQTFDTCVESLNKMLEAIQNILENPWNIDRTNLEDVKASIEIINDRVNGLE